MVRSSLHLSHELRPAAMRTAVRRTLAYADIFDYPLTASELHRYLHGERAHPDDVRAIVEQGIAGVAGRDGFYAPNGRLRTIQERRRRQAASAPLLARARFYALLLKHLPYVRMLGLTGSLAMRNLSGEGTKDIDLMVVTAPGRVWLCRAAVIAIVRLARLTGDTLCPNYVVSEHALAFEDTSLYSAHELAQMVPLYGRGVYRRLWSSNPQVQAYLPNARPRRMPPDRLLPGGKLLKQLAEGLLGGTLGDRLEIWEQRRKVARLRRQQHEYRHGEAKRGAAEDEAAETPVWSGMDRHGNGQRSAETPAWSVRRAPEIMFSGDQCKGHFGRHRARVLAAYRERLTGV